MRNRNAIRGTAFAFAVSLIAASLIVVTVSSNRHDGIADVAAKAAQLPAHQAAYYPATTSYMALEFEVLEARVRSFGISIEPLPDVFLGQEIYGMAGTVDGKKVIYLPEHLSVDARFEILAHEAAHSFQPNGLEQAGGEVFAELVSCEVARYYGHDMTWSSARYMSAWKAGLPIVVFIRGDIDYVVRLLTGQL